MHKIKMPFKDGEKINENLILIVGFVLIILVIIFTLLRGKIFRPSINDSKTAQDSSGAKQASTDSKYPTISADSLNKKIMLASQKEAITLLDVRPFDEYINEHILDSINIPLDEFPAGSKIDTHSLTIIIGKNNTDENISNAVAKLKDEKIENITVLAGGMESWKQLIGATVTYGNPKSFVDQSKVSYLDPEKLNDALTQKVPVYIIDVRSSDEFNKGHITGAINIPFEDLEKKRSEVKEKKIIIVGTNELQEFQASVQLYDMLLASPFVMRTAMPGWESKGFALVK